MKKDLDICECGREFPHELARLTADGETVCPDCVREMADETAGWKCKDCGCTDADCSQCIERTGEPCHWIRPNLCSACGEDDEDDTFLYD